MKNLNYWAENISKKVFEEWKSKYQFWGPGFKIFYGPVRKNPKLMILSFNPGGDSKSFETDFNRFNEGDFSIPEINSYISRDHPMAKKMKNLFHENVNFLESSVTFPILFFRSKNIRFWEKSVSKIKRKQMEYYCYELVLEIIEEIKPEKILVLGFATYRILKKFLIDKVNSESSLMSKNKRRLAYISNWNGVPIFCTLHPTGNRIRTEDWNKIKKNFNKFTMQSV